MNTMNKSVIFLEAGKASLRENRPYLEQCQAIRRDVFINEQGVDEKIDLDGNDEICAHLLLLLDDEAVGTARIRKTERGTKLERIAVLASHRGQGLGEILVRSALSLLDEGPYIHAQMTSLGFYTNLGFVQEKAEIYYEANIPHTTMILPPTVAVVEAPCPIIRR